MYQVHRYTSLRGETGRWVSRGAVVYTHSKLWLDHSLRRGFTSTERRHSANDSRGRVLRFGRYQYPNSHHRRRVPTDLSVRRILAANRPDAQLSLGHSGGRDVYSPHRIRVRAKADP